MDMRGKDIVLYSSGVAAILVGISTWLTMYLHSPQNTSLLELNRLLQQLQTATMEQEQETSPAADVVPVSLHTRMGWIYPGEPACDALADAAAYRFDVIKPEFFLVTGGGALEFMTDDRYVCNGFSAMQTEQVRSLSDEQFVMVSSSYAQHMEQFLRADAAHGEHTERLVEFVVQEDFTGVELDFEDYGGWTPDIYEQYRAFLERLGTALHAAGKELMIDLPPVRNADEEAWYVFRLGDFTDLPVDYIVIMGYDYQFDHGVGEPVAPLDWLAEVVQFSQQRVGSEQQLVIGIPSYGYVGNRASGDIQIVTYEQATVHPLYSALQRDTTSAELMASDASTVLVVQDTESIEQKIKTVTENGVGAISLWHLGGNQLPAKQ